jgi:hypothetical protein
MEVNRLVVRRTRVALCIGLATVAAFAAGNHVWWSRPPRWTDVMNLITAVLIGIAFAVLTLPSIQRRPVPFALVIFALGCCFRAIAGVGHGDVAPTAIILVALALIGAATMPWGVLPQIATAGIAGSAIAMNNFFLHPASRGHARGSAAPVTRHAEGREGCRWGTTPRMMGRVI